MAIKGLKEALAKKKAKNNPAVDEGEVDVNARPAAPKSKPAPSMKPQKKAAGRGR